MKGTVVFLATIAAGLATASAYTPSAFNVYSRGGGFGTVASLAQSSDGNELVIAADQGTVVAEFVATKIKAPASGAYLTFSVTFDAWAGDRAAATVYLFNYPRKAWDEISADTGQPGYLKALVKTPSYVSSFGESRMLVKFGANSMKAVAIDQVVWDVNR